MIDDDGEPVRAELPDAHNAAGGDGMNWRTGGRADADAIPTDGCVAFRLRAAKRVEERAGHWPVEAAVVARLERAGASSGPGTAPFDTPAALFQDRDGVGQL